MKRSLKVVIENLLEGVFSHVPFRPLPLFPRLEVGCGEALLAPSARENDICSYQTRSISGL